MPASASSYSTLAPTSISKPLDPSFKRAHNRNPSNRSNNSNNTPKSIFYIRYKNALKGIQNN